MRSLEISQKTVTLNKRGSGVVGLAPQKVAEKRYAPVRKVCAKLFPIWTVVIDHFPARFSMQRPWFHADFLAYPAHDG